MNSKTPNYDAKIKQILDSLTPGERTCELTGKNWYMDEEEIGWYKKFNVPPSKMAPHTRWQLAIGHYTGYQWWWQRHPDTGEPILSATHPATRIKVLPDKEWFEKDFASAGRDYSPDQSFFTQFRNLQLDVPTLATRNFKKTENSIAFVSSGDINSYFVLASETKDSQFAVSAECERSNMVNWCKNAFDSYYVSDSGDVFNSKVVLDSKDVMDSSFVFSCRDVAHCFFVSNQKHKKYLWYNEQLSRGEYEKRIAEIDLSCRSAFEKYLHEFFEHVGNEAVWLDAVIINSPGCSGDYILDCLDCKHSYQISWGVRDCYWVINAYYKAENSAFVIGLVSGSDNYYSCGLHECSGCMFGSLLKSCQNVEYSMNCFNCVDCFGCVGLNHKKFHIFNKEYAEQEYWTRVDKLKCAMLEQGEYGEFFPLSFSGSYQPQGGPALYLGTEEGELERLGALMFDPTSNGAIGEDLEKAKNPIPNSEIPDCLPDDAREWAGKPLLDVQYGRKFSLIKPEIEFYQKHGLPLPNEHFIPRFQKLNWLMNVAVFEERQCDNCGLKTEVALNKTFPNRRIYCRKCFFEFEEKN